MKKYFLLAGGVITSLFTTSCNKDWECTCNYTYKYNGTVVAEGEDKDIYLNTTKEIAKENCVGYSYEGTNYEYTNECELKAK